MATIESKPQSGGCPVNYPALSAVQCPYPVFDQMRDQGGVVPIPGRENEFLVADHALIVQVARDHERFSSHTPLNAEAQPGWEQSVFSTDPPEHTPKRKVVHASFKPGRLKDYKPKVQRIVDNLIDGFIDRGSADFVNEFSEPMSAHVMFELLGLTKHAPVEDWMWLTDIDFEGGGTRYLPQEMQDKIDVAGTRLHEQMEPIVQERLKNLGDDLMSDIIRGHRELRGDEHDDLMYLTVESTVVLLGGVLTTAHLTGNAMKLLIDHPDQMAELRADRSLIVPALEEALRFESAQQFMTRFTTEDLELGGVHMPRGSVVLVVYASANRDPNKFDDADRFDIHRTNVKRHLGFGHGAHFCVGAPLARLEGELAFNSLFDRMSDIRFAPGKNEFEWKPSMFTRGLKELHIEFDRA
ncbi:MAG: cytochrome P450 [Solirubrobacteraceae bacterium]